MKFRVGAFVTGEAAGVVAALSAKKGISPRSLCVGELQKALRKANAWMSIGSICRHGHAGRVTLPWAVECCKVELVGARVPRVRVEKEQ